MERPEEAKPDIEFTLGGKKYILRATLGVLNDFQRATGKGAFDTEAWTGPSETLWFTTLLWAAIVQDHPEVTLKQIENQLAWTDLPRVKECVLALIRSATPKSDEKKTDEESPEPPAEAVNN